MTTHPAITAFDGRTWARIRRVALVLSVAAALLSGAACRATSSASLGGSSRPDTAAARQFSAWLAAFNADDQPALVAYHRQSFPYEVANADLGNREREAFLRHETGGLDLTKTEEVTPTRVIALVKEHNERRFARAVMEVAPAAPHPVVRFEFTRVPTPEDLLTPEERIHATLDDAKRRRLIEGIAGELQEHYVFPKVAEQMIATLRAHAGRGDYDQLTRAEAFTAAVLKDLRDVSHDLHIRFVFGPRRPDFSEQTPEERLANFRRMNFGFGPIERLPGNVARLPIIAFYPLEREVRDAIERSMTEVADADALLIDLRENHGGQPDTVALILSYLFDPEPVHLTDIVWHFDGSTQQIWTVRDVPGPRFGRSKPVYVLTSRQTISAGEGLAYDLKNLHRARVVGETTAGAANPAAFHDLDDWFKIGVPGARAINPVTKTSWEGVGVVPDVAVPAGAALEAARRLAVQDVSAMARSAPPRHRR